MRKRRRTMRDHKKYHARPFREDGMSISTPGLPTAAHVLIQVVHQGLREVFDELVQAGTWSSGIRKIHRVSESFEQHARAEPTGPPSRAARSDQGTTQPLRHTGAEPETGWAGRSDLFRQM